MSKAVLVISIALAGAACGHGDQPTAAEPPNRGLPSELFASSVLVTEGEDVRRFEATALAGAPAAVSCRWEVRDTGGAALRWASQWRVVTLDGDAIAISLDDVGGQEALSYAGPGSPFAVQCRGRSSEGWVQGEHVFTQPLHLAAPRLVPVDSGLQLILPSGGMVGWVTVAEGHAVSPRQVVTWSLLEGGGNPPTMTRPAAGYVTHYWWGSRALPCLQGSACDDSAWAEVMLWLRHSEVSHESTQPHHAEARH